MFNIEEIKVDQLNCGLSAYGLIEMFKILSEDGKGVSDETLSWSINNPPIYASHESREFEEFQKKHAEEYINKKAESIRITKLIKNEFFEFLCTESKLYSKEKSLLHKNINLFITGISSAIATNLGGIELGIVTPVILAIVVVLSKMSKRIACAYLK
jgi:hypothetical protein